MKLLKNRADSETSLGDQRSDIEQMPLSSVCGEAAGLGEDGCLLNFQLFLHTETFVEKPESEKWRNVIHSTGGCTRKVEALPHVLWMTRERK